MKFSWVTIHSKDLDKSLEFYNEVLGLRISSLNEDIKMAMLGEDNEPKLEILQTADEIDSSVNLGFCIGLEVDSLEETKKVLEKNKIELLRDVVSPAPYIKFMFVKDPDGYEVQLIEFIK